MENRVSINGKVRVTWNDRPENYTRENRNKVKRYFADKYGIPKDTINVVFKPIRNKNGDDLIVITDTGIENIMDVNYQRGLFKEWLKREKIDINFKHIVALDDKVNAATEYDEKELKHLRWDLKWLVVNNFLSFGENPPIYFNKLKGTTVINSIPENQGGKCIRGDSQVVIEVNLDEIENRLGFIPEEFL